MTTESTGTSWELKGIERLQRQWGDKAITDALVEAAKVAGAHTAGEVATVTPVNKNPTPGETRGRLAAGWNSRARRVGSGAEATIGNNVFYGPYVNYGTGIYAGRGRIRAKQGKVMVFKGMGGGMIFARSIKGQRGQHFAEKGLDNASKDVPRIVVKRIEHELDRQGSS
mgnify:CR=1 FL=1